MLCWVASVCYEPLTLVTSLSSIPITILTYAPRGHGYSELDRTFREDTSDLYYNPLNDPKIPKNKL